MGPKGSFKFLCANQHLDQTWIVAWSLKEGGVAILSLTERKSSTLLDRMVLRPYVITRKKRKKKERARKL